MTKEEGMTPEEYIAKIEEENKKLKESDYRIQETERWKHIFTIEQNKANRKAIENTQLRKSIKKLKEKVETLELWLDNKEKLNEEYRKEIDKYKRQYEHSMGDDDELIYEEGLYD